eukprot:gene37547-28699_t
MPPKVEKEAETVGEKRRRAAAASHGSCVQWGRKRSLYAALVVNGLRCPTSFVRVGQNVRASVAGTDSLHSTSSCSFS